MDNRSAGEAGQSWWDVCVCLCCRYGVTMLNSANIVNSVNGVRCVGCISSVICSHFTVSAVSEVSDIVMSVYHQECRTAVSMDRVDVSPGSKLAESEATSCVRGGSPVSDVIPVNGVIPVSGVIPVDGVILSAVSA